MSVDVRLSHPCPHLIMEEVVHPSGDVITTSAKISSARYVKLVANDEVVIPPGGYQSQAVLTGATSAPFRVDACRSSLRVKTSVEDVDVTLPSGRNVTAEDVAVALRTSLTKAIVTTNDGRVSITDASSYGLSSYVMLSGEGAASVGFANQRGARGRKVYPGWSVVSSEEGRVIKLEEPFKGDPVLKVTYSAEPSMCPRCAGGLIENDYRYDLEGDTVLVQDENLLYQASIKILLTRLRSNPYHPSYGSQIMDRIGSKAISGVASQIVNDVQNALSNMQQQQNEQSKYQAVSLKERLYNISTVRVTPDPADVTAFNVDVTVSNGTGLPINLTVLYRFPGTRSAR